jgi:molybdopterin converting factor small subunit
MNEVLLLDVVLGGLCALGFLYCIFAGRRLTRLYRNREGLQTLLEELSISEEKNRKQIDHLEAQLKGLYKRWEEALQKGEDLKGDLDYFISRGESLMGDMDPKIREFRSLKAVSEKESLGADKTISVLNPRYVHAPKNPHIKQMAG